jgi:hypothetical protein
MTLEVSDVYINKTIETNQNKSSIETSSAYSFNDLPVIIEENTLKKRKMVKFATDIQQDCKEGNQDFVRNSSAIQDDLIYEDTSDLFQNLGFVVFKKSKKYRY